ncbi:MAG: hypothetical protein ABIQ47_13860, partial [Tepidiformaceae bacterium]
MPNSLTTPRRTRKAQVALHTIGLALMAAAMGLAGVGALRNNVAVAAPTTTTVQVGQTNGGSTSANQYNSASVTIPLGDTVSFIRFAGSHDATSAVVPLGGSSFVSPSPMAASTPFAVTPAAGGIYTYYCTIHSDPTEATLANIDANIAAGKMVGKIVVNAPAAPTATPTAAATAPPTATAAPGTAVPTATTPAGATATPTAAATTPPTSTTAATATPASTATPTPAPPPPAAGDIQIIDFAFSPTAFSVAPG